MRVPWLPILLLCAGYSHATFNYNIFRWPTFKLYKGSGPLHGLTKFKDRAFSHYDDIKRPIVQGFQDLKNHVLEFKKIIFEEKSSHEVDEESGYEEEVGGYQKKPRSHYGQQTNNKHGFVKIELLPIKSNNGNPIPGFVTQFSGYGIPESSHKASYGSPPTISSSFGSPQNAQSSNNNNQQISSTLGFGDPQPQSLYRSPRIEGLYRPPTQQNYSPMLVKTYPLIKTPQTQITPQTVEGSRPSSHHSINAPLSAAMALGHILTEDEVILVGSEYDSHDDGIGQWRPIFRPSLSLPTAQRLTATRNVNNNNNNVNNNINDVNNKIINVSNTTSHNRNIDILFLESGSSEYDNQNIIGNSNINSNININPKSNFIINNIPETNILPARLISPASNVPLRTSVDIPTNNNILNLVQVNSAFPVVTEASNILKTLSTGSTLFLDSAQSPQSHALAAAEEALSQLTLPLEVGLTRGVAAPTVPRSPQEHQSSILITDSSSRAARLNNLDTNFNTITNSKSGFNTNSHITSSFTLPPSGEFMSLGARAEAAGLVQGAPSGKAVPQLLQDLGLSVMADIVRRADLQAMLTQHGQ